MFLVPRPGIEPAPPALGSKVLTTGPPGMSHTPDLKMTLLLSVGSHLHHPHHHSVTEGPKPQPNCVSRRPDFLMTPALCPPCLSEERCTTALPGRSMETQLPHSIGTCQPLRPRLLLLPSVSAASCCPSTTLGGPTRGPLPATPSACMDAGPSAVLALGSLPSPPCQSAMRAPIFLFKEQPPPGHPSCLLTLLISLSSPTRSRSSPVHCLPSPTNTQAP